MKTIKLICNKCKTNFNGCYTGKGKRDGLMLPHSHFPKHKCKKG